MTTITEISSYKSGRVENFSTPAGFTPAIHYFTSAIVRYLFATGIAPFGTDSVRESKHNRMPGPKQFDWLHAYLGTSDLTPDQNRQFVLTFQHYYRNNIEEFWRRSRDPDYGPVHISTQCLAIFERYPSHPNIRTSK